MIEKGKLQLLEEALESLFPFSLLCVFGLSTIEGVGGREGGTKCPRREGAMAIDSLFSCKRERGFKRQIKF